MVTNKIINRLKKNQIKISLIVALETRQMNQLTLTK